MIDILKKQQCNNKFPKFLPEDYKLAHKTGDLPGVEHDVGIFEFNSRKIVAVVLTKNLQNNEEGVQLCNKIGKLIFETYKE
jgi:beta-lactamase class A